MHTDTTTEPVTAISTVGFAITEGLGDGAKLRLNRMLDLTPKGLAIPDNMNEGLFRRTLQFVKLFRECGDGCLADLWRWGVATLGEDKTQAIFAELGFKHEDLLFAKRMEHAPLELRLVSQLGNDHFYLLGALEDDKERKRWQWLAEEHGLSVNELQKSIAAGRVVRQAEIEEAQGGGSGFLSFEGLGVQYERIFRRIGGEEKILALPVENLRRLYNELAPVLDIGLKLKARLGAGEGK